MKSQNTTVQNDTVSMSLRRGFKDGIPIGLGYFAVSFSLGIAARNAGLNAFQGFLMSLLNNASAGEYAGISAIESGASYLEIALLILVANARYLLMSTALSQKFSSATASIHRFLIGFDVTDELFGIGIAYPGNIRPSYMYGAFLPALSCWSVGTALGVMAGNLFPASVVAALSAAIYGMFLAIIIPPCRTSRPVLIVVMVSFALSLLSKLLPLLAEISEGFRIIILTLIISAAAAVLFPVPVKEGVTDEA